MKRPAYEPATNPPPQKRPPVEEEDAISIPLDEEEDLGISISLTDEERLNLVSPLLTSKVTVSVLNIAWHWFLTQSVLISVNTYYPWLGCMSALAHMYLFSPSTSTHAHILGHGGITTDVPKDKALDTSSPPGLPASPTIHHHHPLSSIGLVKIRYVAVHSTQQSVLPGQEICMCLQQPNYHHM